MANISALPSAELRPLRNTIDEKRQAKTYPRVSVRVGEELKQAIDEVIEMTGMTTPSEVMRRSFIVYHTLLQQKAAGNEPCILIKENGQERTVPIFEEA